MANDVIVIEYQANINNLQKNLNTVEGELLAIEKESKKSMGSLSNESKKAASSVDKVDKQVNGLGSSLSNLSQRLPFAGAIQETKEFGESILNVGKAAGGPATKGMQLLRVAMLSLGITAIIAGIASLVAYFKRTEEGGDRLARIMSVLGVIMDELIKGAAWLGEIVLATFDIWLKGATQVYEFIAGTLFAAIEGLADVLGAVGFEKASEAVDKFNGALKQGKKDMEGYVGGLIAAAEEVANLKDALEDLTIDIGLQNDKLTTSIEKNLKALRNRTNTYKENLGLIEEITKAEEQRFANTTTLINKELEIAKKQAALETSNDADAKKALEEFLNLSITTDELKTRSNGLLKAETINNIVEILHRQEAANRESLVLEERIQNLKDANAEREKQRLEKIRLQNEKIAADRIKAEEDRLKKIEEIEKQIAAITEKEANDSLNNIKDHYTERLNEQKRLLVDGKITEKQFADASDAILLASLEDQKVIYEDYGRDVTAIEGQILDQQIKLNKKKEDEAAKTQAEITANEKKENDNRLALQRQALMATIDVFQNAATAILEVNLAQTNAQIENERDAFDTRQNTLLESLNAQKEAGLLSEAEFNIAKEKLDIQKAKKESQLKQKQFKAEQQARINMVALDTATAVVRTFAQYGFTPFAAIAIAALLANAAIQTATIRATPVPKFEKGGMVDGKSHKQGGVIIEAEGGEWVVDKRNTGKHQSALEAMSGGYFDKYVNKNYVVPAMRKAEERERSLRLRQANTADNIMNALSLNGYGDMSHLERLTKSNKKVIVQNLDSLPKAIGNQFEKAIANKNYIK